VKPAVSSQPFAAALRPVVGPRLLDRMQHYDHDEMVDAVVIGTGPGGAPLFARLAQAGLKVVALEAGPLWDPFTDFATDERTQEKLYWPDERLRDGEPPALFGRHTSGYGVGGGSLSYAAFVPRPQPDDFSLGSETSIGEDWPIGYSDLAPYFDEVERILGVSGPSPYSWGPPRTPYPRPPLPLNGPAQLMRRGCFKVGIQSSPAANAALSRHYGQPGIGIRHACTNRGFCEAGCSTGAKGSMDVTYIPLAIRAGAELRPDSHVTLFEIDAHHRIGGVVYTHEGREYRQRTRTVFLCAGAIETPRLLLLNDMANRSGQVGRNAMTHTALQVWGQFDEAVRPNKGVPSGLISEDMHRPAGADFAGGYLLQSLGVLPVTYAALVARGLGLWGTALHDHMQNYNHVAGIMMHGDCLPSEQNFIELADELDERGLPKPLLHFTAGTNERAMAHHGERLMRDIWEAAGAGDVWALPRDADPVGTCRMGNDPERSVVNANGRSHDLSNLYISDASTFPSALSANPALTIMALSLRTADRFLAASRVGDAG
jgi:choline dehydrogenase-like flavoprotein